MDTIRLTRNDALIIVDVQNDFLPGGNLAVPDGDKVVPILNRYIDLFVGAGQPIHATRDWHPANHCSFAPHGGIWPPHCIRDSKGAEFAPALALPAGAVIISKAATPEKDAYSGFEGTDLAARLRAQRIERVFVGGLATDYCVLNTVRDALAQGFEVGLLLDAIRAVDVHPGDGKTAIDEMIERGAQPLRVSNLEGHGFSLSIDSPVPG
jgi:nicotinamidase/pyrazinamidase